jgi:hypothetical protein
LPTFVVSELARLHWEFVLPLSFVPLSFVILGGPSRNSPFGCGFAALCLCELCGRIFDFILCGEFTPWGGSICVTLGDGLTWWGREYVEGNCGFDTGFLR